MCHFDLCRKWAYFKRSKYYMLGDVVDDDQADQYDWVGHFQQAGQIGNE